MAESISIESIRFVKELYPRLREDDAAIERYRAGLGNLPPIVVARGGVLVDGFHRWQAHRREKAETIQAEDLGDLTDAEIVREAITRNATHGQQLSAADKKRLAGDLWLKLGETSSGSRVDEIAQLLSVSPRSVQDWTKDARATEKAQQQAKAWDLWLDCHDLREIAAGVLGDAEKKSTVDGWVSEKRNSAEFGQAPASRQHFDVWEFWKADETDTPTWFGKMPPQVVENLLWLYTEPGQIVFDPFAGSGTTIEVAKAMGRRVWASDLTPSTPTLPIHGHDIAAGWPKEAPKKADFILLDPPYWKQAAGKYSGDASDMGNMDLDAFMHSWKKIVFFCKTHLAEKGYLAFIISPSVDGERVVDHAFDLYAACQQAKLKPHRRIIVTYQTQQATGQQVEWARREKQLLERYRDLVIMRP